MAHQNSISPAATAYAQAAIELAADAGKLLEVGEELAQVAQLVREDGLLQAFFADPAITPRERWEAIQKSFAGRTSQVFLNLLGVMNEKGRLPLIGQIAQAYQQMLDERQNRVRVEVTVAQTLNEQELAEVQTRVGAALGKTAIVEQRIDDSIIGGLVLRVQDKMMDASVKAQLEALRRQLLASRA